jgi:hypothetical protein
MKEKLRQALASAGQGGKAKIAILKHIFNQHFGPGTLVTGGDLPKKGGGV